MVSTSNDPKASPVALHALKSPGIAAIVAAAAIAIPATGTSTAPTASTRTTAKAPALRDVMFVGNNWQGTASILKERSHEVLTQLRARIGEQLAIISVGGVTTPEDAQARLDAGANLVQGYTAFIYEGPFWPGRINRALARFS